jgi:hypothetical protein
MDVALYFMGDACWWAAVHSTNTCNWHGLTVKMIMGLLSVTVVLLYFDTVELLLHGSLLIPTQSDRCMHRLGGWRVTAKASEIGHARGSQSLFFMCRIHTAVLCCCWAVKCMPSRGAAGGAAVSPTVGHTVAYCPNANGWQHIGTW